MARKKRAGGDGDRKGRRRRSQRRDGSKRRSGDLVDHSLMKALSKRLRAEALAILTERVASPKAIAEELGESLSMVSYHVKALHKSGLIELDHKVPRRGAVEHFYRAVGQTVLPRETWDNLPAAMREGVSACIVREFIDDASASAEAGIFDYPASDLCWIPLILDGQGIEEVGKLADEFVNAVLGAQATASERLRGKNRAKDARTATVFLASFLSARDIRDGKRASAAKRR